MDSDYEVLSDRKRTILMHSVEDYIKDALPITSKDIHDSYLNDISTATLRNELNALEAMGYLKQLHTSSGRVPTSKAYRLYVDYVLSKTKFKINELDTIRESFNVRCNNLTSIIENVAKTISKVTNYPTVAVLNDLKNLIIEDIKFIPLIDYSTLMLIQTNGGVISNTFEISNSISNEDCINCATLLNNAYAKKSLNEFIFGIKELENEENEKIRKYKEIFEKVVLVLKDVAQPIQKGKTKLLDLPEYKEVDKAKQIINILENEEKIKDIITTTDDDVSISIGKENQEEGLYDCAVVTAPIKIGEQTVASVGVIGPQRLDYELVAGAIKYVVGELQSMHKLSTTKTDKDDLP